MPTASRMRRSTTTARAQSCRSSTSTWPASGSSTTARAIGASRWRRKPGGELTWAEAAHESPYGRIESSWWTGAAGTTLIVQVPPNTEAVVSLPDGAETLVGPGRSSFRFSVA